MILAKNHRERPVSFGIPIHFDGKPADGTEIGVPLRFVLFKLGPTVWKLAPSINHPLLHAYITIIQVPTPAPWEGAIGFGQQIDI